MPYKTKWKDRIVFFEYFGQVTSNDIRKSNQEVYGDARFDDLKWEIVIFQEAESVTFEDSDIRLIAYMDKAAARSNPYINVAFVGTDEILDQVEKAYSGLEDVTPWPVLRFDSIEEAISYIEQD